MDVYIATALNEVIGRSVAVDLIIDFLQDSYLVKGLFAACILFMLLASNAAGAEQRRTNVYATLVLVFAAIFLGRILQMALPFSTRPLYTEGMGLAVAAGLGTDALRNDSSFPSDHALMFVTMAASVLMYHRLAGAVLMLHALFIVCLPRVALGFHWFSDVLAGAVIGGLMALLLHRPVAAFLARTRLSAFAASRPALFQAVLFAILCETATMYGGSRKILSFLSDFASLAI